VLAPLSVLLLPALDPLLFFLDAAPFDLDLLAEFAIVWDGDCGHHQAHSTCFASAVFFGTVLTEVAPLIVAACKLVLVEEAHFGSSWTGCQLRTECAVGNVLKDCFKVVGMMGWI